MDDRTHKLHLFWSDDRIDLQHRDPDGNRLRGQGEKRSGPAARKLNAIVVERISDDDDPRSEDAELLLWQ